MATTNAPDALPFSSLKGKINDGLLQSLDAMGYEYMSPVQQKVLSELPTFQSDCLVQAKTGTGKTIAFLLPALQSVLSQAPLARGHVAILIVSPTRELALQIAKECESVTAKLPRKLECHTAYGGTSRDRDLKRFTSGDPKIVVATPGRLNDLLGEEDVRQRFQSIKTLILDEADQMLEAGFLVAITDILRRLPPKTNGWQGMCFSATMPKKIEGVLPKVLKSGYTRLSTINADEEPTIDKVPQHSVVVPSVGDTFTTLRVLLQREYELQSQNFKVIVFGATANGVALMHSVFSNIFHGTQMQVFQLQSRLSQNARTRTTNEFKEAPAGIMFASDVIGRGMDFPNVSLVVQVGIPSSGEQYVHRVGRTARAGNEGRAVILLTQRESFFLKVNKNLPITPYPENLLPLAAQQSQDVEVAFNQIDELTKAKAYQAWLGFHKTFTKQLQLNNEGLIEQANEYAATMGCPEPPMIDKRVVGKMGLKGVRGLNIGTVQDGPAPRRPQRPAGEPREPRQNGGGRTEQNGGGGGGYRGGNSRRGRGGGRGGARGGRVEKSS
ncbi:ATP-dependent RNA helicase, mitochondrial [Fulvia fulva]|uniref:ATP-dependent RNA helicase n=1 Tax=Passalora fulva TaxID=5499 RepID=A0A9Q8PLA6_PASFU|nr:ATP-dependent RNA helicase, mitochondrial [Fulvia fulva]KAK4610423.1 ATP-dependent RNA helicase, mitochondrial [Fulvia fulva]KAK4611089.1 ATP-dependent RNA helicase, mitochondrial [Fulvia fulva]UJO24606.1 ATP-dependent RNA helicase, mitochondrial [Fulvia fulva]WPV22256.1 ATP-dependent RNA helicase, mitochondrial [Fulvia fulva]WPV36933.1 ATP-dependent RNA helicase, mitochondrial [Fulvia fulva]